MDTKLRSIKYHPAIKAIAFILAVVFVSLAVTMMAGMATNIEKEEALFQRDYLQSNNLTYEMAEVIGDLLYIVDHYKNEENILAGNTIKSEFENQKRQLYENKYNVRSYNVDEVRNTYGDEVANRFQTQGITALYEHDKPAFEQEYSKEIDELYKSMIQDDLRDYKNLLAKLENVNYYIKDGESVFTNVEDTSKDYFSSFKVHYLYDRGHLKTFPQLRRSYYDIDNRLASTGEFYFAFSDEHVNEGAQSWKKEHETLRPWFTWIILFSIGALVCIIYLFWAAGIKGEDRKVHFLLIDRLYGEFTLMGIVFATGAWTAFTVEVFGFVLRGENIGFGIGVLSNPGFQVFFLLTLAASSITLALLLSVVRRLKSRTLIKHTIFYIMLSKVVGLMRGIFNSSPFALKVAGVVVVFALIISVTTLIMFPLMLLTAALAAAFVVKKLKDFETISKGIKTVRNGNINHNIKVESKGELAMMAEDINAISQGLKFAVEKEVKSERMKAELVTNVSHDLKTPLTSIISYVDLLSKEEDLPEHVKDYIKILSQKSDRLKTIIQDLFDLSKAASGSINLDIERLDFAKLMRQTLADLEEEITQSGLVFKVKIPEDGAYIMGDGSKLYRVFQNIINNALKYSLEGSRVYVELEVKGNNAKAVIKNTSSYEMTFTREEILERFTRGEVSRTTEGSGLGLSIAKSFTEICGGAFDITIDGDLFKAELNFKVIE